jgi:hypothetical protein
MGSWRDVASAAVQKDIDALLETALLVAKNTLIESGEFLPFPVAMQADGEVLLVAVEVADLGAKPAPAEVFNRSRELLRQYKDTLRATAIAIDIKTPGDNPDAIEVRIEHRDGTSLAAALPYERKRFAGGLKDGTLRMIEIGKSIWV